MTSLISRLHEDDKVPRHRRVVVAILLSSSIIIALSNAVAVAQVKVRVETISDAPATGRFIRLTESQLELLAKSGQKRVFEIKDVLSVSASDFDNVAMVPVAKTPWVILSTGDRLRMSPLVIDDENILAEWSSFSLLPPLSLPLELCRGIVISAPAPATLQGRSFDRLFHHRNEVDLITLNNGDRIEGEFVSLKDEQFTLDTSIGEVRTSIGQTQSLAFNPDLISVPETSESFSVLVLSDGSTLHVRSIVSDGDVIIAESTGGFQFSLPITTLRSIGFYDTNRINLARLKPMATKVSPYLSMSRQPKVNRSVIGSFLSLRGRLVPSGFGVTSGTAQVWNLDKSYSGFRATVGVDDAAQGAGSVVFKILVDGSTAWESDQLTGKSAPVEIPSIDLSGANELSLMVEMADRGHVLDYANWCEPVLIRKTEAEPE